MGNFAPSYPESEQIELVLTQANVRITNFIEYSFNSHFLTPTDGFSFTIGTDALSDEQRGALTPGAAVQLTLNGTVESTGYIDSITISASRSGGTEYRIEGRDVLAQAVDACSDPTQSLKEGQTLEDVMKTLFSPFGWSSSSQFLISDQANADYKSQQYRSKQLRSEAKGFSRRALKEYKMHQARPYPREGVFEFASRLSQRFGLWIWATADGKQLVVSEPNFDLDPFTHLRRNTDGSSDGGTNVLDGSVKFDAADQPTIIVADSYSRGGEFGRGVTKCIFVNSCVRLEPPDPLPSSLDKYLKAGATVITGPTIPASSVMVVPRHRILYLHDDESTTQEQLESYVRREMALLQRKSLTVSYTVEGHGQDTQDGFIPWTVDTTVAVEDDVAGLHETLYILGRTFNKSRGSGTTTHLELIRKDTLVFSDGGAKSQ